MTEAQSRNGSATHTRRRKASPRADSVEQALRQWLVQRRHRPGDRLPPDTELAQTMGVARGTLRTALRRLEESGHIVRRQGSGTFVRSLPEAGDDARQGLEILESYSALARRQGHPLELVEVSIERTADLTDEAAEALSLEPGEEAVRITRVLRSDGAPAMHMTDIVHPSVPLPRPSDLRRRLLAGRMVLDILLSGGVPVAYGRTRVRSRLLLPDGSEGTALGIGTATAALEMVETTHLADGTCVKFSQDLFVPGAIDLHIFRAVQAAEVPASVDRERRAPRRRTAA